MTRLICIRVLHKCGIVPLLTRCPFTVLSNQNSQGSRGITTVCLVYRQLSFTPLYIPVYIIYKQRQNFCDFQDITAGQWSLLSVWTGSRQHKSLLSSKVGKAPWIHLLPYLDCGGGGGGLAGAIGRRSPPPPDRRGIFMFSGTSHVHLQQDKLSNCAVNTFIYETRSQVTF